MKPGEKKKLPFMYLWVNGVLPEKLDDKSEAFVKDMMHENLEHARHVENERMTFFSVSTGIIAAIITVTDTTIEDSLPSLMMHIIGFIVTMIAFKLNKRWDAAFKNHMHYAKGCYSILECNYFPDARKKAQEKGLEYCVEPECAEAFNQELNEPELVSDQEKNEIKTLPLYGFNIDKNVIFRRWVDKRNTSLFFFLFYAMVLLIFLALILVDLFKMVGFI